MNVNRIVTLAAVAANVLAAAQLQPPSLKQLSKKQFQQLLSKSTSDQRSPVVELGTAKRPCSIPLQEAEVKQPERSSMQRLPVNPPAGSHSRLDPGIVARNPAPACKNWYPRK